MSKKKEESSTDPSNYIMWFIFGAVVAAIVCIIIFELEGTIKDDALLDEICEEIYGDGYTHNSKSLQHQLLCYDSSENHNIRTSDHTKVKYGGRS